MMMMMMLMMMMMMMVGSGSMILALLITHSLWDSCLDSVQPRLDLLVNSYDSDALDHIGSIRP